MKNAKCIILQKERSLRKNAELYKNDFETQTINQKKNELIWVHSSFIQGRFVANPDWMEAYSVSYNGTAGPYEYFIETRPDGAGMYTYGSLYIFYYGMDTSDTPDVKIVF